MNRCINCSWNDKANKAKYKSIMNFIRCSYYHRDMCCQFNTLYGMSSKDHNPYTDWLMLQSNYHNYNGMENNWLCILQNLLRNCIQMNKGMLIHLMFYLKQSRMININYLEFHCMLNMMNDRAHKQLNLHLHKYYYIRKDQHLKYEMMIKDRSDTNYLLFHNKLSSCNDKLLYLQHKLHQNLIYHYNL